MHSQLLWFLTHRECIAHRDQYLLTYSPSDIPFLPLRTKIELTRLLTQAQTYYARDLLELAKGQTRITDFFTGTATTPGQ